MNLTKLEMLLLNNNKIQCLEAMAFSGLKNLKILSLYQNDLSALPETAFADLTSLKNMFVFVFFLSKFFTNTIDCVALVL